MAENKNPHRRKLRGIFNVCSGYYSAASSRVLDPSQTNKKAAGKSWKEKVLGASGSVSGVASVMGSWQICHNVCLGIIAVLAVIGITVTGMPLLFLNKIAVPMWSLALVLLLVTGILYYTKRCFSRHLLFFNTGLIIAGIPFPAFAKFQYFFWTVGGALALASLLLFIKEKKEKKGPHGT